MQRQAVIDAARHDGEAYCPPQAHCPAGGGASGGNMKRSEMLA
ncbi:hypothetical protein V3F56_02000 [Moorellaceae bacterium AZ2]